MDGPDAPQATVGGPSYPRSIQALASLLMAALVAAFVLAFDQLPLREMSSEARVFLVASALAVGGGYLSILLSRTTLSQTHLREGWLLHTEVCLADIVQVKWLRWRWLDAVVAPRLVVRAKGRGVVTFHVADPALRDRVEMLVRLGPQVSQAPQA